MAITLEELEIKFNANISDVKSEMSQLRKHMLGAEKQAGHLQNKMLTLGKSIKTAFTAFLIKKGFGFAKNAALLANEVSESENLFEESMKGLAHQAKEWSEELSAGLGLNAFALRKNIGTMNVMLKSMGFSSKEAYKYSKSITELAEDMASFYNLKSEDAFAKLQSGLTGVTMPLKALGILIDDETIKQVAYKNGIAKAGAELNSQQKVLARYQAIMEQTSAAQGDLARTIDSPANQLRVLSNLLNSAKISFGQAFQPIQAIAIPVLNALARAAMAAAQAFSYFMRMIMGFGGASIFAKKMSDKSAKSQEGLSSSLDKTSKALKGAGGAARKAAKDANVGLKAFDEINKLADEKTKTGGGGGGGGLDGIKPPEIDPFEKFELGFEVVSEKIKQLAGKLKAALESIKSSLTFNVLAEGFELLKKALSSLGLWALNDAGTLVDALSSVGAGILAFKVGGPIAGAAVGFGSLIVSNLYRIDKALTTADLKRRFGDVEISLRDFKEALVDVKAPFTDAATQIVKGYRDLQSSVDQLNAQNDIVVKKLVAVSLGVLGLDPEDFEALKTEIEARVAAGKKLLSEAKLQNFLSIDMIFGDDTTGRVLKNLTGGDWEILEKKYASKAEQLYKLLAKGFQDGMSPEDKAKAAAKLLQEMAEIENAVANSERNRVRVKMGRIEAEFKKGELSYESITNFKKALDEQKKALLKLQEDSLELAVVSVISVKEAALGRKLTEAEFNEVMQPYKREIESKRIEAEVDLQLKFGGQLSAKIKEGFKAELEVAEKYTKVLSRDWMKTATESLINGGKIKPSEINTTKGRKLIADTAVKMAFDAMVDVDASGANTRAVQRLFKDFKLDERGAELQELINSCKRLGIKVPQAFRDELNSIESLRLLTQSATDMLDYIEKALSKGDLSPAMQNIVDSILEPLSDTQKAELYARTYGKTALDALRDALNKGTITKEEYDKFIRDGLVRSLSSTPGLVRGEGAKTSRNYSDGLRSGSSLISSAGSALANWALNALNVTKAAFGLGQNVGKSYADGVSSRSSRVSKAAERLGKRPEERIRAVTQTHSPSKVGTYLGKMLGEGYAEGIENSIDLVGDSSARAGLKALSGLDFAGAVKPINLNAEMSAKSAFKAQEDLNETAGSGLKDLIAGAIREMAGVLKFDMVLDGRTLGQASIKALNDEQRLAGRILLEM